MTTRSPALAGLMAMALSIYGMALGGPGGPSQAQEAQGGPTAPAQDLGPQVPFACSLVATAQDGGTAIEGWLQAREAISATYDLKVRGAGVSIDQGGDLTLAAGETTVLGEAQVSGGPDTLDVDLTVTVDGRTYACPLQES
jgi:curli production assembly/transport CsgH protein